MLALPSRGRRDVFRQEGDWRGRNRTVGRKGAHAGPLLDQPLRLGGFRGTPPFQMTPPRRHFATKQPRSSMNDLFPLVRRKGKACLFAALVLSAVLAGALAANLPFFTKGQHIYHINSVSAPPLYIAKMQQDRFRNGDFSPAYFSSRIATGAPVHNGVAVFNPVHLLASIMPDFVSSLVLFDILMRCLGGLGLFALLRTLGVGKAVSVVFAACFPLNQYFAATGQDPYSGGSIFVTPWALAALESLYLAVRRGDRFGSWAHALLLALALTLVYLCTSVQGFAFILCFVVGRYAVARLAPSPVERRGWEPAVAGKFIGLAALAFGLGMGMLLFEIVPMRFNLAQGYRRVDFPLDVIWFGTYLTLATLGLQLWLNVSSRKARAAAAWCVASILVASQWRMLAEFAIDPLPRLGYDDFIFELQKIRYYATPLGMGLALLALAWGRARGPASILLCLAAADLLVNPSSPWLFSVDWPLYKAVVPDYARRHAFVMALALIPPAALGLEALLARIRPAWPRWAVLALLAALFVEAAFFHATRNLFTEGLDYLRRDTPEYAFLRTLDRTVRVGWTYDDHQQVREQLKDPSRRSLVDWLYSAYFGPTPLCVNAMNSLPLRMKDYFILAQPKLFGLDRHNTSNNLFDLTGARWVFSAKPVTGEENRLRLVCRFPDYYLYENPTAFPRVMLFDRATASPRNETLQRLLAVDRDELDRTVFLDEKDYVNLGGQGKRTFSRQEGPVYVSDLGAAAITQYGEDAATIECEIKSPCLLMFTDTLYPGWKAYVNGEERPILEADAIFRGVMLQPGHHVLRFAFERADWKLC